MKKILTGLLGIFMLMSLVGCGSSGNSKLLGLSDTNLYEEYKNCDKGFDEYCFYYTREKADKVWQFEKRRKEVLDKIAESKEVHNIAMDGHLFSKDQYVITKEKTGYIYVGKLKNNSPDGIGMIYREADPVSGHRQKRPIYQGEFKEGRYEGYGILYKAVGNELWEEIGKFPDGAAKKALAELKNEPILYYEGEFKEGEFSGKGNLYDGVKKGKNNLPDLDIVSSEFKKGKANGKSVVYFGGLVWYEGEMENDKFNGEGKKYNTRSGYLEYKGHFKNDEFDGKGISYDKDGNVVYEGKWKNGEYSS